MNKTFIENTAIYIDGFNYRVWHYKNYHVMKISSYFVGKKRNKVNRILLTIQYSNQVFENEEQLVNRDIEYLFSSIDIILELNPITHSQKLSTEKSPHGSI